MVVGAAVSQLVTFKIKQRLDGLNGTNLFSVHVMWPHLAKVLLVFVPMKNPSKAETHLTSVETFLTAAEATSAWLDFTV